MSFENADRPEQKNRRFLESATVRAIFRRVVAWFTQDPGEAAEAEIERAEALAIAAAAKRLKAGAAKIAQILGYWEDHEQWSQSSTKQELSDLFDRLPTLPFSDVAAVFQAEFGASPLELFQSFEQTPFAAASLGQVHAARAKEGTICAVKIQYPGVAEALRADLAQPDILDALLGGSMGEGILSSAKQALCDTLLHEVDYERESRYQSLFQKQLSDEPLWVVPQVHPALCSKKVLTTHKLEGEPLLSFLSKASLEQSTHMAALLFRYGFETTLRHGLLNTDPNPGNFLVLDGGYKLGLLDFGSCLSVSKDQVRYEQILFQSILADDAETFRYTLHRMGIIPSPETFDRQDYRLWEQLFCLPYQKRVFHFSKAYAKDLISATGALVRNRQMTWPAQFILLFRQRLGLFSLLGYCDASIEARSLLLHILSQTGMAPAGITTMARNVPQFQ